jgi:hypothetical protein
LHIGWHLVVFVRWGVLTKSTFSHFLPLGIYMQRGRDKNVKIRLMAQLERREITLVPRCRLLQLLHNTFIFGCFLLLTHNEITEQQKESIHLIVRMIAIKSKIYEESEN